MATTNILGGNGAFAGSPLGTALTDLLMCPDIQPGSTPSYQICKEIFSLHPVGKKMVDAPIGMAQSQNREITVAAAPGDRVVEAFQREWLAMGCDRKIEGLARLARIYGKGAFGLVQDGVAPNTPLDFKNLSGQKLAINVLDPLNTASSIGIRNQDPNAATFQTIPEVAVAGVPYHPSRSFVLLNEMPIYIEYTTSAFGYSGRSVYQRALYPLKSFVQSMRTDDLVIRKAGVIIAKIKQIGGMVDNVVSKVMGAKRALAQQAITDDVLSIGPDDVIESLNLMNLEGPYGMARRNIIENIATAADMPAIILNSETYAEGFGEGTEDAKKVASYVDGVRLWMDPAYAFLDEITMYRAWTPDLYEKIQADFPDQYGGVTFDAAFASWKTSFKAVWPSLVTEPDSKKAEVGKVRFESAIGLAEVMLPKLGPINQAKMLTWLADITAEENDLFRVPLELDPDELEDFIADQAEQQARMQEAGAQSAESEVSGEDDEEPKPPKPRSIADSSVARLADRRRGA